MNEVIILTITRAPKEPPHSTGPLSVLGPVAEEHGTRDRAATRPRRAGLSQRARKAMPARRMAGAKSRSQQQGTASKLNEHALT